MTSKRALVVDDSKSARAFLSRILERHEITVDAAESAEAAIEYLARHRPDVIFMDHMMPGMDGFQAVQTIKNNPRTSSIPILMYTSQEGDLYLGQARALGAEGVLPKQIKQADVTRMLFQLRLVSERRSAGRDQTTFTALENVPDLMPANESAIIVQTPASEPAAASASAAAPTSPTTPESAATPAPSAADAALTELLPRMSLEIRAAFDASLQREIAALRGFVAGKLDAHADRMQGDLSALLPAPSAPVVDAPPMIPERRASTVVGWTLAVLALAAGGVLGWMWWGRGAEIAALKTDLTAAYGELETLRARPAVVMPAPAPAMTPETVADPNAVLPAADADSAAAGLETLVPNGGAVTAPVATPVPAATPIAAEPAPAAAAAGSLPKASAVASSPPQAQ